jgi:hypothetical protein
MIPGARCRISLRYRSTGSRHAFERARRRMGLAERIDPKVMFLTHVPDVRQPLQRAGVVLAEGWSDR